jgi:hypothetical protein
LFVVIAIPVSKSWSAASAKKTQARPCRARLSAKTTNAIPRSIDRLAKTRASERVGSNELPGIVFSGAMMSITENNATIAPRRMANARASRSDQVLLGMGSREFSLTG